MAQVQKGHTYGANPPDNQVTSSNLNAHVDSAVLLPGAITEQTDIGAPTTHSDYLLIWDASASAGAGALRKVSVDGLLYADILALANMPDGFLAASLAGRLKMADTFVNTAKLEDAAATAIKLDQSARQDVHQYATGTLASGVYAVTLSPVATAYTEGMTVKFKASGANVGAVDVNVNALGAKHIYTASGAGLVAGQIASGQVVELCYDGTQFQIVNPKEVGAALGYPKIAAMVIFRPASANTGACSIVGTPIGVADVQKTAIGYYTVNFSPALPNASYAVFLTLHFTAQSQDGDDEIGVIVKTAGSMQLMVVDPNGGYDDPTEVYALVYSM